MARAAQQDGYRQHCGRGPPGRPDAQRRAVRADDLHRRAGVEVAAASLSACQRVSSSGIEPRPLRKASRPPGGRDSAAPLVEIAVEQAPFFL